MAAPKKEPDLAGSASGQERRPQLPQLLLKRDHLIGLSLNSIKQLLVRSVLPQVTEGPNRRNGQLAEFSRDRFGLFEVCRTLFDGFLAEHLPPPRWSDQFAAVATVCALPRCEERRHLRTTPWRTFFVGSRRIGGLPQFFLMPTGRAAPLAPFSRAISGVAAAKMILARMGVSFFRDASTLPMGILACSGAGR
jgi:hypothetical protein